MTDNFVAANDKFMHYLGIVVEEAREDYARAVLPITRNVVNGMGIAHGGAILSLADIAFGAAANAGDAPLVVTLASHIDFLNMGTASPLRAEARLVRGGKHIVIYDVEVRDADNVLVARCSISGFRTAIRKPESPAAE